jgi:hypothetical protein
MTVWHYDLETTVDPLLRLGIHGLYRLLKHSQEDPDNFPNVKHSETLRWGVTDTVVAIQWETVDDLHLLLDNMLGSFVEGLGINPGYPAQDVGSYATAMTHTAILSTVFSGSMRGPKRALSLNSNSPTGKARQHRFYVDNPAVSLRENVAELFWGNTDKPIVMKFSPMTNTWDDPVSKSPRTRLGLRTTAKGKVAGNQSPTGSVHPSLLRWNNVAAKLPAEDYFAMAFSCLAYVYTQSRTAGVIGVGIDMSTFEEADRIHQRYFTVSSSQGLLTETWSDPDTTAHSLMAHLRLPANRSYNVLVKPDGDAYAHDLFFDKTLADQLYNLLQAAFMRSKDSKGLLVRMDSTPVKGFRKGGRFECTKDLLSVVRTNLHTGRPWYAGLSAIANLREGEWAPYHATTLTTVAETLETPMEEAIRNIGRKMIYGVMLTFKHKGFAQNRAYDKAREFVVKSNLRRAKGRESLFEAIARIQDKGSVLMSDEECRLLDEAMKKDSLLLKDLLISGCYSFRKKKVEEAEEPVAAAAK